MQVRKVLQQNGIKYTFATLLLLCGRFLSAQSSLEIRNVAGLRVLIANTENPALAVILPGYPDSDRSIDVIFPEHVTAKRRGNGEPEHLYLSTASRQVQKSV